VANRFRQATLEDSCARPSPFAQEVIVRMLVICGSAIAVAGVLKIDGPARETFAGLGFQGVLAFRCRVGLVASELDTLTPCSRIHPAGRKFGVTVASVIVGGVSIVRPISIVAAASFVGANSS